MPEKTNVTEKIEKKVSVACGLREYRKRTTRSERKT